MSTLLSLPNLASSTLTEEQPWNGGIAKSPVFTDPAAYRAWRTQPSTQWYFLSGFEGQSKFERISANNPPAVLRAVIGDWDCAGGYNAKDLAKFHTNIAKGRFAPTAIHSTPSGGLRAIWLLETPVFVDHRTANGLLKRAVEEIGLKKMIHGFDAKACTNTEQTFAFFPTDLIVNAGAVIPHSSVVMWKAETVDAVNFDTEAREIAIEDVAKEIDKQYPGKWKGPFQIGARGVRFWDPVADNPTGARVAANGFICYTGPDSFVPWSKVLGHAFVAKFAEKQFGEAVKGIYSDGARFWVHYGWGWGMNNADAIGRELRNRGLSAQVLKGEETSELMRAVNYIEQHQKVAGRAPFVFRGDVVHDRNGIPYLNSATAKALRPADKATWRECATVLRFLRGIFNSRRAFRAFLAELKRAYVGAYNQDPKIGHCLVLCGPPGIGKTFLTNRIIGALLGGFTDSTDVIMKGSRFNDLMLKSGIAVVDDGGTSDTEWDSIKAAANVKKLIAQRDHCSEAKYESKINVEWTGRLVLCCNDDPSSLTAIPTMTTGTADKIALFRMSPPRIGALTEKSEAIVAKELPKFARWLIDLDQDKLGLTYDARYGFKPYVDESLRMAAEASSPIGETLREALDMMFENNRDLVHVQGTATKIRELLIASGVQIGGLKAFNPDTMGRSLTRMADAGMDGVRIVIVRSQKQYRIDRPEGL